MKHSISKRPVFASAAMLALLGSATALLWHPVTAQEQEAKEPNRLKQADATTQGIFDELLGSIEDNTYASFHMLCDDKMKIFLTKPVFDDLDRKYMPRFTKGYRTEYLCSMKKGDFKVHYWKTAFQDGSDDALCEVFLKGGQVGGFYLR